MSKAANLAGFATAVSPPNSLTVGIITATAITGNLTGTATGLTGTPNVTVGVVTATSVSVSGNVSIAGTLTYEDVTNVDSVGIVTARSGIRIGNVSIASTLGSDGGAVFSGIVTATSFVGSGASLTNLPASGVSLPKIYFINN